MKKSAKPTTAKKTVAKDLPAKRSPKGGVLAVGPNVPIRFEEDPIGTRIAMGGIAIERKIVSQGS